MTFWHFAFSGLFFAFGGWLAHILRGHINAHPDRLTDSIVVDLAISDGFSLGDWLFGVEYDDYGFYRADSPKNLRISVMSSTIGGLLVLSLVDGAGLEVAQWIDWLFAAVIDLVKTRFAGLTAG